MKKPFKNKYVSGLIILLAGVLIGWLIRPQDHKTTAPEDHLHTEAAGHEVWTCSMHPQVRRSEPGQCPICGMDLVPLSGDSMEEDLMAVNMTPTAMQLANVQTMVVGYGKPVKEVRMPGKVQADERRIYSQTTHVPGRIEKLLVNFTGESVRKGQPLALVYSPELVTAQKELLEALKIRDQQPALFDAARDKLKNWKLTEKQIDRVIASGTPIENFPVLADVSGIVLRKNVNTGEYVTRGMPLFDVADLSQIWVLFDVYEADMPWVKTGSEVTFTVSSIPGETFSGTISFIDPVIDPETRVAKARVAVPNPDMKLKPEMFATGTVRSVLSREETVLVVPKSAVMWTGERSIVYVRVASEKGTSFRMQKVTLGPSLGDSYIIRSGLEPGVEIAVHGTFSIDAAAQLSGKPSMMNQQADPSEGRPVMPGHHHGGMQTDAPARDHAPGNALPPVNTSGKRFEAPDAFKDQLKQVFETYLKVKNALVAGDAEAACKSGKELLTRLQEVNMTLLKGEAHDEWMKDLKTFHSTAGTIAGQPGIAKMRTAFSPLSDQLYHSLVKYQVHGLNAYRQFCPMALDDEGAYWLSDSEEIRNPYFGDEMLTCGNIEEELN